MGSSDSICGRTGKKNVFERRGLENAVVGEMQQQIGGREERETESRGSTDCRFSSELVVIPAKPALIVHLPRWIRSCTKADCSRSGRFPEKAKTSGGVLGIELSRVGDRE